MSWGLEQLLFVLAALVAVAATTMALRRSVGTAVPLILGVMVPCLLLAAFWLPEPAPVPEQVTPQKTVDQGYVSSQTCRACHPGQYASWYKSYHRTMTQVASPETIAAPQESVSLHGGYRRFDVRFEDGAMFADDVSPWDAYWAFTKNGPQLPEDFPRIQGEVVMTTGSHHMQLYWVPAENGGLTQLTWAWMIRDQRWVPGEAVYLQPPNGPAGLSGTWERNCIKCHSTGGQPRLALGGEPPLPPDARVGELGIACEACHGPGAEHIAVNRNVARRYSLHLGDDPDPTIINPKKLEPDVAAEACANCHSGRLKMEWDPNTGGTFRPGKRIDDFLHLRRFENIPEEMRPDYFWGDGTSRVTGREYTALVESGCFTRGDVTCSSCHSMHGDDPDDQLTHGRVDNDACLACHGTIASGVEEHTRHDPSSPGSQCYNCHMPNTTYGLLMLTRSHRIDSPSVANNKATGKPNACNLCHVDRPLAWADERLVSWYGTTPTELDQDEREVPAAALWLLKGDAVTRATAAWHLGWEPAMRASGTKTQPRLLARGLGDPYSAVRYLSEQSLRKFKGFEDFDYDFTQPVAQQSEPVMQALRLARPKAGEPKPALAGTRVLELIRERDRSIRRIRE
ncbi:MAG: hypothetical protein ACI8W3_000804 [Myxococcota bacterium]|jgi:hypothetical protein